MEAMKKSLKMVIWTKIPKVTTKKAMAILKGEAMREPKMEMAERTSAEAPTPTDTQKRADQSRKILRIKRIIRRSRIRTVIIKIQKIKIWSEEILRMGIRH